jgi:hypothetical protein
MASQPPTAEAIAERRKSYTRGCPECGVVAERKSIKGPPPIYCCDAHKKAFQNRQAVEGRALIAFAKAWRLSRNNRTDADLGAACLTRLSATIDLMNERDRKEGRTTLMTLGYADGLLRQGISYLDLTRD